MANPAVVVDFLANTRQLQKALGDAEKRTQGFGGKLKSLAKGGAFAAGAAGVGGLVATVKIGIGEFAEAQKVAAQTNAVLESTGSVANVSADHVDKLAGSIMRKSGIDDEAVASGENLLLTFTNVRNEVGKNNDIFDQSTKIMADMSTALGQDMKTSALQLGKALNDPVKGMTALRRVGVSFTDAQKDQVKALQAAGDTMGAQKVILKELQREFGGSAEAAGKTLPGQLKIARETFNNFAGMLVAKVIPVLEDVIAWLRDHWPEIRREIQAFWNQVQPIFANLIDIVVEVVDTIRTHWGTIGPIVMKVAAIVGDAVKIITGALRLITDLLKGDWSAAWKDMQNIVKAALDGVKNLLTLGPSIWLPLAKKLGQAILDGVTGALDDIGDKVRGLINSGITFGEELLGAMHNRAAAIGNRIVSGVVRALADIGNDVRGKITAGITFGEEFLTGLYNKAVDIGDKIKSGVLDGAKGLAKLLSAALLAPMNVVISLWNAIPDIRLPRIEIPDWVPKIGGKGFGGNTIDFFPNIPLLKFAKGGVVDRPTLAMVGEGSGREIVAPEPLLRQLLAESRPDVRVYIGDRELRDLVRVEVRGENNRVAQTLLAGRI